MANNPSEITPSFVSKLTTAAAIVAYCIIVVPGGHGIAPLFLLLFPVAGGNAAGLVVTWGGMAALVASLFFQTRGLAVAAMLLGSTALLSSWADVAGNASEHYREFVFAISAPFLLALLLNAFKFSDTAAAIPGPSWQFKLRDLFVAIAVVAVVMAAWRL